MPLFNPRNIYIAVSILSLMALLPFPYGYYTFLRIVVFLTAGITAYLKFKAGDKNILHFAVIAILFNPIIPIALSREVWAFFNVAVAILFGILAYRIKTQENDIK